MSYFNIDADDLRTLLVGGHLIRGDVCVTLDDSARSGDCRPFPIQGGVDSGDFGKRSYTRWSPSSIPWWLADIAYREYSRRHGNRQSLERLAQRGGFGRNELVELLAQDEALIALQDGIASIMGSRSSITVALTYIKAWKEAYDKQQLSDR